MRSNKISGVLDLCFAIAAGLIGGFYGIFFPLLFILEPPPEGKSFSILGAVVGFVLWYIVRGIRYLIIEYPGREMGVWFGKAIINHKKAKIEKDNEAREPETKNG